MLLINVNVCALLFARRHSASAFRHPDRRARQRLPADHAARQAVRAAAARAPAARPGRADHQGTKLSAG